MFVGAATELEDALAGSVWGREADYGAAWTLDDQPGWSLHLRSPDPDNPTWPGAVYARRRHASHGPACALLTVAVTPARLEALLAVLDGTGDLRDLARLLRTSGPDPLG